MYPNSYYYLLIGLILPQNQLMPALFVNYFIYHKRNCKHILFQLNVSTAGN